MKKGLSVFVFLMFLISGCADKYLSIVKEIDYNVDWQFSEKNKNNWKPATVPGVVQIDLFKNGVISDPLNDNNEAQLHWIGESDWTYKSTFIVTDSLLKYKAIDFVFEGLDTYANVYLNDSLLLTADNMFREWRADSRRFLHSGQNTMRVEFYAPAIRAKRESNKLNYHLPAPGNNGKEEVSVFVRKAAYQFGWDWSPRFLTMGIWKPVKMVAHDKVYISNLFVKTIEIADTCALLSADVTIYSQEDIPNATVTVQEGFKNFRIRKGNTTTQIKIKINQPELWWPNGMGIHKLYDITAKLFVNGYLVDSVMDRTGVRTIELIQEDDEWGNSFYFRVNGLPVFMKGANYVPQSNFLTDVTNDDYKRIIKDASSVGMNMLRVWGGGVYENKLFYDLCDENGILVWQDFMFACGMYPFDSAFVNNVKKEVEYQVMRLRNHPCLALWCGNNEVNVACNNWGWQNEFKYSAVDSTLISKNNVSLFDTIIPNLVHVLDPYLPYTSTSPLSNWGHHDNFLTGDMHYWGVWHGEEDIDSFRVNVPRFMSEYGMQSFPSYASLKNNTTLNPIPLTSPFIQNRQRSYKGNGLLIKYIESKFGKVGNTEDLCYLSQLNQSEAMRIAIESQRKEAQFCMGSLYWQLNDVWDGASWSTIEHNGKWKAAHYQLKKLYARDVIIAETKNDTTVIYIQTDNIEGISGNLVVDVLDFKGRSIGNYQRDCFAGYLVSAKAFELPLSKLLGKNKSESFFLRIRLIVNDKVIAETNHFFTAPNQLLLPTPNISKSISVTDSVVHINLSSDIFVKDLMLEFENETGTFSENYFDLLPGETKTITFSEPWKKEMESELKMRYFKGKRN